MSIIIKKHDVTLYGSTGEYDIILRPLCDEHLPILYKWNADPEVVYWSDTGNAEAFDEESVCGIYGSVSQSAFCFLVEVNGKPIGDFWLQKMNIPEVSSKYPGLDIRRIEASIGEKALWGKGIGTAVLGMLIDFAFNGEYVDMLYCFAADYNTRSQKTLLKHGFRLCGEEDAGDDSLRAKKEYHYQLTRREYTERRRSKILQEKIFDLPLTAITPSYAAIVARYGGLDGRSSVIILTDNKMLETAQLVQTESEPFVKSVSVINLDETDDCSAIYALAPEDLLILHIGIESWMGRHRKVAHAFDKPEGVAAKYICIRPTITPRSLLEGLNTPDELTGSIVKKYGDLPNRKTIRITAKSGTDISLAPYEPFIIPYNTHTPGANAYLPPAEVSYSVVPGSANGLIVVDVTVGELRVYADLIDSFGLVDAPVILKVESGEIVDVTGGTMAHRLKGKLWKLPNSCRKIVELGIGLSRMTPSGIIGIDESIDGTCHFGIGNGSGNDAPIHLDVVIDEFNIE